MICYFSGEENLGRPELVLGDAANLMLTYINFNKRANKPDKRFRQVVKARRRYGNQDQQGKALAKP